MRRILSAAGALVALMILAAAPALAQTGSLEGLVKVKMEDGSVKPVPNATVDIIRLDIKGSWEVKADKSGRYVRLGLPLIGQYVVVASAPGIAPTWVNGVRLTQTPQVDIIATPGDGTRMTVEQVLAAIKGGSSTAAPTPAAPSASDRAAAEKAKAEFEAKKKEAEELQANFESARGRYNQGVELMKAQNYQGAIPEFEAATAVDPTKHQAFAELAYKANANLAEAHYQIGADLFNQRKRDEAKAHFEKAVDAINKAITVAGTSGSPTANTEMVVYYNILAKNAALLVEFYNQAERVDPTVAALDKAIALDPANKGKWNVMRANLFRFAGRTDEAVEAYKAVLAEDPNNLEAVYNLGLTLLASTEKATLQQAANYLADFVAKAPADDKRVPEAKASLEVLKKEFQVEAEKPARRRGRP